MSHEDEFKKIEDKHIDLKWVREKLASVWGNQYWKSFEQIADTEQFRKYIDHEFPHGAFEEAVSRRDFLKFMGASLLLAGLSGCSRQPTEKIVPYVKSPENMVPGKPLFFATAMPFNGWAKPILVESHMGRPTKIEGNPEHGASLGAADAITQASILGLYDPDRSQAVKHSGRISTWESFVNAIQPELIDQKAKKGAGLRLLTGSVTSPTFLNQIQNFLTQFPSAKWHHYEPVNLDHVREGARLAFGENLHPVYDFKKASVILSLDSDFLGTGPGSIRYTKDFSRNRQVRDGNKEMNRLYVVESVPSITGNMADHLLTMRSDEIEAFTFALAKELGVDAGASQATPVQNSAWVQALARDLKNHKGSSLIIAGDSQPPLIHTLAHALNAELGNSGQTVTYIQPPEEHPELQIESIKKLTEDIKSGQVEILIVMESNPVFDAPHDLEFEKLFSQVKLRVHLGLYDDETAFLSHWHVPAAHYLETWSDARSYDGTISLIQPLIEPLYGGKSAHELLAFISGQAGLQSYDILQDYWKKQFGLNFETTWKKALHDGFIEGSATKPKAVRIGAMHELRLQSNTKSSDKTVMILFRPDSAIWDGEFINNGWLQELPRPMTKITWDNPAWIAPAFAEKHGLSSGDVIEIGVLNHKIEIPVWVMPGHASDAITLHYGYGRRRTGKVGTGTGFNVYPLRNSGSMWTAHGAEVRKTGKRHPLAATQNHHSMEGRDLIRTASLEDFIKHPEVVEEHAHHHAAQDISFYPQHASVDYAWGMAIDLNACTGCSACVIACQAENNVPVVGKEQVINAREMHWIRIDRYYQGDLDHPEVLNQPILCMHCENAPCEPVCPVGATVHSEEGLNEMVYNRCVGTRYCSNNCPYKVRRFNFLEYVDNNIESLKLMRNPDVTVRARGVMEKCTYCVQRISHARIEAKKESRSIRDGEIVTACQATCPADAIVFGNILDPESQVAKLKATPLDYGILTELNTRPRTSYLAKLRNLNPEIVALNLPK